MEFLQWGRDPWDQEVLLRISWDLFWLALSLSLMFVLLHLGYRWRRLAVVAAAASAPGATATLTEGEPRQAEPTSGDRADVPERVTRHTLAARLFHWVIAASMLVLLATGFLPVVGVPFGWVTIHWIAGLVLVASVVAHVVHVAVRQDFGSMKVKVGELRDGWRRIRAAIGRGVAVVAKPGKYPLENKLYHHTTALMAVAVMATGLLMMVRVPTPLLARNPYLLSEATWGLVYVVHGLASVAFVVLVVAHLYLAARPEKRWLTRSMIAGWIDRQHYLAHHDPARWVVRAKQ